MGKHVYVQKPLTHSVYESRLLTKLAEKHQVATQMGNQGHSHEGIRLICEWIWDGAIGEVREVDAWCSLSYYPFGHASWSSKWSRRPADEPAVPEKLDWDLWLGPERDRPFSPHYTHTVFRGWYDFGTGALGDMGCHHWNIPRRALKLGHPTAVSASATKIMAETWPLASTPPRAIFRWWPPAFGFTQCWGRYL